MLTRYHICELNENLTEFQWQNDREWKVYPETVQNLSL